MSSSGKRKPRKTKKRSSRKRRAAGRRWRIGWLAAGVACGLALAWTAWLNHRVVNEFEGRRWDVPSRVYARPLALYPGQRLTPADLETELAAAGYRPTAAAGQPGEYQRAGTVFTIHRRPFRFPDGPEPATVLEVRLAGDAVAEVAGAGGSSLGRLDPAPIASIWPLHDEDRVLVELEDAPALLVTGLQAVEDRRFKHHHGVDPVGIARALVANVRAGAAVQGGSTLTQQLVKNYFLDHRRSLVRKANEAVMAVLLEWHYDKGEILEAYLNEVWLGQHGRHGIHGFGRAAEFYFDQPLADLPPERIALLIGLAKGASLYNPRRHPERALQRRNAVLDQFAETSLVEPDRAEALKQRPLGVVTRPRLAASRHPAFVDLVRRQLRRDYRNEDLQSEGLRIFTTLAPAEQEAAENALSAGLDDLAAGGLDPELQGALVLADVDSGEIRAVVGDRDPQRVGFNRALDARRQVGSVIKPLVYLLALEHDRSFDLLTRIDDAPVSLRQPDGSLWEPGNYDGQLHGEVTVLDALVHSYNLATVQLGMQLGVPLVVDKLRQLGIEADVPPVPATLLGAVELTPMEVTQVYQSLAAGGYSVPLRAVTAVLTPTGETLNRYPLRLRPLARRDAVGVLNFALTEVVERGTARALPGLLGRPGPVAGKTGTTNERRDSWFVGFTGDRVAVAWVGRDDNAAAGVTGSNAALRVWAGLFRQVPWQPYDGRLPDGAHYAWVEPASAAASHPDCPGAERWAFVDGTGPDRVSACGRRLARAEGDDTDNFWSRWLDD